MDRTYSLVLDTVINSFSLMTGTLEEIVKQHKKWVLRIKKNDIINIPEVLPVSLTKTGILAIRVVEIPPQAVGAYNTLTNPRRRAYAENFLNKAEEIEEKVGTDLLDQGFKQ
jgi:hypothetical protein